MGLWHGSRHRGHLSYDGAGIFYKDDVLQRLACSAVSLLYKNNHKPADRSGMLAFFPIHVI